MRTPAVPTMEYIVETDAYEARMHFLKPGGKKFGEYITRPASVSALDVDTLADELPRLSEPSFLMWVDFFKPEVLDTYNTPKGTRYSVLRHRIGGIAVITSPDTLQPLDEALETPSNTFLQFWLALYAMDKTRTYFGDPSHPMPQVHDLYRHAEVEKAVASVEQSTVVLKETAQERQERIIVGMARRAYADFPDLSPRLDIWTPSQAA